MKTYIQIGMVVMLTVLVSACFPPQPFPLPGGIILELASTEGGTVEVDNYPAYLGQCSEYSFKTVCYRYNGNEVVTLTPQPLAGYEFSGWKGACTGTGPCTVTMNRTKSITAHFSWAAYDFSAVMPMIQGYISEYSQFRGAAVTIVHKDIGVVYQEAIGNQRLDTIALVASASKVPAAGILMSIIDEGLMGRNQPIETLVPWRPVYTGMTIEQTLSNTSGIPGLVSHAGPEGFYMPHLCNFLGFFKLRDCARLVYDTDRQGDYVPPGTVFQYGGGQWQLAGGVAQHVTGKTWATLVQEKLVEPCGMTVLEYGLPIPSLWNGHPDTMSRTKNPYIGGGAIGNITDFGKLMLMHLNGGMCGDNRVMSEESVLDMQTDRAIAAGKDPGVLVFGSAVHSISTGYGLGWWILLPEDGSAPAKFMDPGAFGSLVMIDTELNYGIYVQLEDYRTPPDGHAIESATEDFLLRTIPVVDAIFTGPVL